MTRAMAHTRFVPTPVYRLMVVAWLVSGLLQIIYGPPASVENQDLTVLDWSYIVLQLTGSAVLLGGLYLVENNTTHATKLHRSLALELFGLIMLQTVIALQVAAVWIDLGRPPSSGALWMAIIFCLWSFVRDRDIVLAMRSLGRPTRREGR